MDITVPISGVPSKMMPFHVVSKLVMPAINTTPLKGLVSPFAKRSPLALMFAAAKQGAVINWGFTPDADEENVASGFAPYSDAIDTKKYAVGSITLDKIKWKSEDRFQDFQTIASPAEDPDGVILELAMRKYATRFVREVLEVFTFGGVGVQGRFTVGLNGSKPVAGRLFYGATDLGVYTPYAPNNGNDLKAQIEADLGAATAKFTPELFRKINDEAVSKNHQYPLYPVKKFMGGGMFSEEQKFYCLAGTYPLQGLRINPDFKLEHYTNPHTWPDQASPIVSDRSVTTIGSIEIIKCSEMDTLTSFIVNGHTYDISIVMGGDALRMCQSSLENGMKIVNDTDAFRIEHEERFSSLYSYFRGYKVPRYYNLQTKAYNDGSDPEGLAEAGVIYIVTKR